MQSSNQDILSDDQGFAAKGPSASYYSTPMVITTLIFALSWTTTVALWGCRFIDIPVPLFSPAVRYTHMSIVVLSTILVRYVGKSELERTIKHRGQLQVTGFQSILIVIIVVSYAVLVMWALGILK